MKRKNWVNSPNMRIVPLGSGGAIFDLEWFLKYRDIKLVKPASKIYIKIDDEFKLTANIEATKIGNHKKIGKFTVIPLNCQNKINFGLG